MSKRQWCLMVLLEAYQLYPAVKQPHWPPTEQLHTNSSATCPRTFFAKCQYMSNLRDNKSACFHGFPHFICISSLTINSASHGLTWCPIQLSNFHHSQSPPETPRNDWGHGPSARLKWSHSPPPRRESTQWRTATCCKVMVCKRKMLKQRWNKGTRGNKGHGLNHKVKQRHC